MRRYISLFNCQVVLLGLVVLVSSGNADAGQPQSMYVIVCCNRVLRFSPPFSSGMSANAVLGQTSFTGSSAGLGPDVLNGPGGIDHDAAGNLFVSDSGNYRVLEFAQPISTGEAASLVLGQSDFISNSHGTGMNQFNSGVGSIAIDRRKTGAVFVAVNAHVRTFAPPFSNGMNWSLQFGNNGSIPQTIQPAGIAVNGDGSLIVSDGGFQRVLIYRAPLKSNQVANVVLGADSLDHDGHGVFYSPWGSAVDSKGNLWVSDPSYNRVLEFTPPFWNDKKPVLVIGHPDLTPSTAPGLSQSEFSSPVAVAFDGHENLWVSDSGNHRILEFLPPFSNGMNASLVIGQPDFTSNAYGISANQIEFPGPLTFAP